MHRRFIPASIAFFAVLLTCEALLAASCLVDLEDQANGAVIRDHGKEQQLLVSKRFSDCSQLVLVRGMIHVLRKPEWHHTQDLQGAQQAM
jgi:hypothetical protein